MPELHPSPEPTIRFRVVWLTQHADGHTHTNHHDHDNLESAEADLESVAGIAHIVSASLTRVTVEEKVVRVFTREGREVGAQGSFADLA